MVREIDALDGAMGRVRSGGDNHLDSSHELVQEVLVVVELLGIAGRLVPTAQECAGEDLPHHVTVLAPRVSLVVAEVRCRIRSTATLPWR